jgi:hypothetical protein
MNFCVILKHRNYATLKTLTTYAEAQKFTDVTTLTAAKLSLTLANFVQNFGSRDPGCALQVRLW